MLGPTTPGGGADPAVLSVFQLLTLLSNPDQARAKLEEITAVSAKAAADRAAADAVVSEAAKLLDEAKKRTEEAEAYAAKTEDQRADVNLTIKLVDVDKAKLKTAIASFNAEKAAEEASIEARDKNLASQESDLASRLQRHEQTMLATAAETDALHAQAVSALAQAQTMRNEYDTKLKALRQIAG